MTAMISSISLLFFRIIPGIMSRGILIVSLATCLIMRLTQTQIPKHLAAIIPWNQARILFDNSVAEPAPVERNVRGSLVTGFSSVDVDLLDIFEGDVGTYLLFISADSL
jgi:hypothetical protein